MVNSAIATGDFFELEPGDKALHCLPTQYIAGKMMLVRAFMLGLELDFVEPSSQPLFDTAKQYDFCAMLPMQLQSTYSYVDNIKTIIVGGAPISNELIDNIQGIPSKVYETYGMTETVTHVAAKPLNHRPGQYFKTLPNVSVSKDDRDCLVIEASHLREKPVVTNDIVSLHSQTEFEWLGRVDNVINSGGVKLFPEQIENKLSQHIDGRFFVASEPDATLGEKLILIMEGEEKQLDNTVFASLDKYEIPKAVYNVEVFAETDSGKIQRNETLRLLK